MQPIYITQTSVGFVGVEANKLARHTAADRISRVLSTGGSSWSVDVCFEDPSGTYPSPRSSAPTPFTILTGSSNQFVGIGPGSTPGSPPSRAIASTLMRRRARARARHSSSTRLESDERARTGRRRSCRMAAAAGASASIMGGLVGRAGSCDRPRRGAEDREDEPGRSAPPTTRRWEHGCVDGLADLSGQEQHPLFRIMENLDAIEQWRDSLPVDVRRRHNHPSLFWVWRKTARRSAPAVRSTQPRKGYRQAIHWPQDFIRRAALAMGDSSSSDLFVLARVAVEAAIRNESDLLDLLPDRQPPFTTHCCPTNRSRGRRLGAATPLRLYL